MLKSSLSALDKTGGIYSLPGALPLVKLSMALLGSFTVGSTLRLPRVGIHSTASWVKKYTKFKWLCRSVRYPSLYMFFFVADDLPSGGIERGCFVLNFSPCLLHKKLTQVYNSRYLCEKPLIERLFVKTG